MAVRWFCVAYSFCVGAGAAEGVIVGSVGSHWEGGIGSSGREGAWGIVDGAAFLCCSRGGIHIIAIIHHVLRWWGKCCCLGCWRYGS
jgi:hypothetical protein